MSNVDTFTKIFKILGSPKLSQFQLIKYVPHKDQIFKYKYINGDYNGNLNKGKRKWDLT